MILVPSVKDMSLPPAENHTAHTAPASHTAPVQHATCIKKKWRHIMVTMIYTIHIQEDTFSTLPNHLRNLQKPEYKNNSLQIRWNNLHSNNHKPPMTSKMSWMQMAQCLEILEVTHSKDFVYKCPKLETKIKIIMPTPRG